MKFKKILSALALCTILLNSVSVVYAASDDLSVDSTVVSAVGSGETVSPNADELVWKYQTIGGVEYKRRWNKTKECWYDPAWIPV